MDWLRAYERLIGLGGLLLSLDFLECYDLELSIMDRYVEFIVNPSISASTVLLYIFFCLS
jgi:hypothetical protein